MPVVILRRSVGRSGAYSSQNMAKATVSLGNGCGTDPPPAIVTDWDVAVFRLALLLLALERANARSTEDRDMTRTIADWMALQVSPAEPEPERVPVKKAMGDAEEEAADDEDEDDDEFDDEDDDEDGEESEEEENADDAGGISPYWV
jgi:hypothetical protein